MLNYNCWIFLSRNNNNFLPLIFIKLDLGRSVVFCRIFTDLIIWRREILTACSVLNNLMCQKIASVSGNETWSDMTYCKCETTWSQCFGNLTNGQLCNINYNPKFWMISHSYKRWTIVVWSGNNYENKASTIITYKYALKMFVSSHPDNRIS